MVKTLQELKAENRKLKNRMEVNEDFLERNNERKKLSQENMRLRHPKKLKFFKKVGKISVGVSKSAARGLQKAGKTAVEFERRQRAIEKRTKKQKGANQKSMSDIRRLI